MPPRPAVRLLRTAELTPTQQRRLRALLDTAFDGEFGDDDWAHTLGGWHALVLEDDVPVAHAAVVPRRIEVAGRPRSAGYVEGVATHPDRQGHGLGSAVVAAIGEVVRAEFELGVLATGRWHFYERLGWRRWRGPSSVWRGGRRVRTPEDDDALMVLPVGDPDDLDPTAPIVCDDRPGDVW